MTSSSNSGGGDWSRDAMAHGRPARTLNPTRQLDDGTFQVSMQQEGTRTDVGMVFVEGTGNLRVEHYILGAEFESPLSTARMITEKSDETFDTRARFFAAMKQRMQGKPVTYIEATCRYFDEIPER